MRTVDIARPGVVKSLEQSNEALQHARDAAHNYLEHRLTDEIRRLESMKSSSDIHDREWLERGLAKLKAEARHLDDLLQHANAYAVTLREDTDRERGFAIHG